MRPAAGTTLLVVILLAWSGLEWSRPLLRHREAPPASVVSAPRSWVLLGSGFRSPGVHQFSDGQPLESVISMTPWPATPRFLENPCLAQPLENGQALDLFLKDGEIVDIFLSWMPAGQRLALGIPLQTDRMSRQDWEDLPGVGPVLAEKIDLDRQENGEFGRLERLRRVRGIGAGRIAAWKKFFQSPDSFSTN